MEDKDIKKWETMLVSAMENLNDQALSEAIVGCCNAGKTLQEISRLLDLGIRKVGEHYGSGDYFLADLIVSGELYQEAIEQARDVQLGLSAAQAATRTAAVPPGSAGIVMVGVVEDDIHDIGKDLVCMVLKIEGFRIIDLGVDVKEDVFVESALRYHPDVVALCGVMSFSVAEMEKVIRSFRSHPELKDTRIIVGGGCMTRELSASIGADGYSEDIYGVADLCRKLMEREQEHES